MSDLTRASRALDRIEQHVSTMVHEHHAADNYAVDSPRYRQAKARAEKAEERLAGSIAVVRASLKRLSER